MRVRQNLLFGALSLPYLVRETKYETKGRGLNNCLRGQERINEIVCLFMVRSARLVRGAVGLLFDVGENTLSAIA